jgi:hypothetical protein
MGRWLFSPSASRLHGGADRHLLTALFVVVSNLIVDVTYAYLDPRIRYG